MVDNLVQAYKDRNLSSLNLHAKKITIRKLHDKSWELIDTINKRFHAIIRKVEEWRMVYVEIDKLKEVVELFKSKNFRNRRKRIMPEPAFPDMYDSSLSQDTVRDISWSREWVLLRKHFYDESIPPKSFHGYAFYSDRKVKKRIKKEVVACVYELLGKEYILIDKAIARHPESAEEFIKILKEKYQKVHDKFTVTDSDFLE